MIVESLQKGFCVGISIVGAALILVGAFCVTLLITALLCSGRNRKE